MSPEKADDIKAKIAELKGYLERCDEHSPWHNRIQNSIDWYEKQLKKTESK